MINNQSTTNPFSWISESCQNNDYPKRTINKNIASNLKENLSNPCQIKTNLFQLEQIDAEDLRSMKLNLNADPDTYKIKTAFTFIFAIFGAPAMIALQAVHPLSLAPYLIALHAVIILAIYGVVKSLINFKTLKNNRNFNKFLDAALDNQNTSKTLKVANQLIEAETQIDPLLLSRPDTIRQFNMNTKEKSEVSNTNIYQ